MKKMLGLAGVLLLAGTLAAEAVKDHETDKDGWKLYELAPPEARAEVYTGAVDFAKKSTLSFEVAGRLVYVAPEGMAAKSNIYNLTGGVIQPGQLLAQQDEQLPLSQVRICEAGLKSAGLRLDEKHLNFQRDTTLHEKKVISDRSYLESQIAYETALYEQVAAVSELDSARRRLDACYIRAPFPCVVNEVYLRSGTVADVAQTVLSIASVEAMKITVAVPEYITRQLDLTTQIRVYPNGADAPVIAWFENHDIKTNAVQCYVANPTVPVGVLTAEEEKLPRIDHLSFVFAPTPSTGQLADWWVQPEALRHDESGSYVWRLNGLKAEDGQSMVPRVVTLEKIPVKVLDLEFNQGIYKLRGIGECPDLKAFDLLAATVPADVRSGDRVVYRTARRLFRPEERVNVVFSRKFDPAVYDVPRAALVIDHATGTFSLRVLEQQQVNAYAVKLLPGGDDTVRVHCNQLRPGMQVVIPPTDESAENATVELLRNE